MELTKNWSRRARIALRAFLILSLLSIVVLIFVQIQARRQADHHVALHHAMMRSVENRMPVLDQNELNASDVLSAAGYLLRLAQKEDPRDEVSRKSVRLDDTTADDALLRRAQDWLETPHHRLVLDLMDLDAGVARARFRSSRDVAWMASGVEGYAELRASVPRLIHLLKTRAFLAVNSGRFEDAYRDVETILRVADWLRMEQPGIVPWLFRNAVIGMGTQALEEIQQVATATAEQRLRLRQLLGRLEDHGKVWGLEGERAFTYSLLQRERNKPPIWSFDRRSYDLYGRLIELSDMPPYRRPPLESILANPPAVSMGLPFAMPHFYDSMIQTDVAALRLELAELGLAWADYYDQHGSHPREPSVLVPEFFAALPKDPWSGEDLKWRVDASGCVLYSFGVNGRDDDAVHMPRSEEEDDITWRLPLWLPATDERQRNALTPQSHGTTEARTVSSAKMTRTDLGTSSSGFSLDPQAT